MSYAGIEKFKAPRSAYLHIPFCHRRCFYCDFPVVPLGDKATGVKGPGSTSIKSYLSLLHREISLVSEGPPLATVYIGGGTPSLLSPGQIQSLLQHLRHRFGFQCGAECTLEIDPASFDQSDLEAYLEIGINRLSLGGQSFDDNVLAQLGRRHRCQDLLTACGWLDDAYRNGFLASWSLDLIQNLPDQDLVGWEKQLRLAISTSAPHLSVYDLSVEPGTVFEWRKQKGELNLPSEELAFEISRTTSQMLEDVGLSRYEISNYALPGHASRHNRVYWRGGGWWGFGQGATSAPWGQRLARPRTRDSYKKWLEHQESYGLDSSLQSVLARPMKLDEKLMTGLRRREGVDLEQLAIESGWNEEQCGEYLPLLKLKWQPFVEEGFLYLRGSRFQLSNPEGMEISNLVLVEMVVWWQSLPEVIAGRPIP